MTGSHGGREEHIVRALITRASAQTELVLSAGRAFLCTFVLIRFVWLGYLDPTKFMEKAVIEVPALAGAILLSTWIARRAYGQRISAELLALSVFLDAGVCFVALLPDVLEPWATYRGLLQIPDIAILPLVCVTTGLRLSLSTAIIGCSLNLASLSALVTLDLTRNADRTVYGIQEIALFGVYVAISCVIGLAMVTRTELIAYRAAQESVRAELAQRSLSLVMQDNHDVRSLLSSAQVNSDLMLRELGEGAGSAMAIAARTLKDDLAQVTRFVAGAREQAYVELSVMADREPVNALEIAKRVAVVLERFPEVSLETTCSEQSLWVHAAGGDRGVERVLINLLINACEGDGESGARNVRIELQPESGDLVRIEVVDDGPGFAQSFLKAPLERFATSKRGSSGLGLYLVKSIVEASGGNITLANEPRRGARVSVRLPATRRQGRRED